jgi:hypothetical protein
MKKTLSLLFVIALGPLVACGGGGGGSDPAPPVPVANIAPNAVVAANFSVFGGEAVSLIGTESNDADGSISSYSWTQTAGSPTVTLTDAATATASFTAPDVTADTDLTFELLVTDNDGATSTATIVVSVNLDEAPVAVAPQDFDAIEQTTVLLDGSASTDDRAISTYSWSQTAGDAVTLVNASMAIASFTALDVAVNQTLVMTFELTVTDSNGASSSDSVTVTIVETPASSTLQGKITYDHVLHDQSTNTLDYAGAVQANVRGATVELLSTTGSIIDTTNSDENGDYSFIVTPSTAYTVRVKAELKKTGAAPTWDFTVVDNTSNKALYSMDSSVPAITDVVTTNNINAPSGWDGVALNNARVAAPFAILDSVYEAKEKVTTVDNTINMVELKLNWSINNVAVSGDAAIGEIGTSSFNGTEIVILGDKVSDTDEYDGHVVVHEWGHYFEGRHSRSDSVGGSHGLSNKLDIRVALGEGFGNALSGIVTDDPFYRDSFGTNGFSIDVESNLTGASKGWFSEASVQSLIYDFYDSNDDDSDALSMGFAPIYQVLVGGEKDTPAFTSIFSFANQLKIASPSNSTAIDSLLTSQDIIVQDDFGTGETNDGGDVRNLPVYNNLTDSGSLQVCSYGTNGQYNKLGNRKYFKIDITTTGSYTFAVDGTTAGDDPDLVVYQNGMEMFRSEATGNDTVTQTISAGTYAMEVYEASNVFQGTVRDTCIDVTLTAN